MGKTAPNYYPDLTDYINANSGLKPLTVGQVKAVVRNEWRIKESVKNPSNVPPMDQQVFDRGDPTRRCKAHRKNGEQCRKWAIQGGSTCPTHGGRAPQVQRAARTRLANAADRMARELLKMAVDENVSDSVKLAAIRDALDRGGVSAKSEVDVSITAKPFEQILDNLESGSRSDFRRSQGIEGSEEQPQIEPVDYLRADDDDDLIVEGEWLGDVDDDDGIEVFDGNGQPITPGERERCLDDDSEPGTGVFGPSGPPPDQGMVSLQDAVAAQADMRKHATLRPIQRALPRGRST